MGRPQRPAPALLCLRHRSWSPVSSEAAAPGICGSASSHSFGHRNYHNVAPPGWGGTKLMASEGGVPFCDWGSQPATTFEGQRHVVTGPGSLSSTTSCRNEVVSGEGGQSVSRERKTVCVVEGWGTKLSVGAGLQATSGLPGLGQRKWGAGSWGWSLVGRRSSSRSRPQGKAAAIVLMS